MNSWLAWTCDAIDFFSVSLSVSRLQTQFHKSNPSEIVRLPPPICHFARELTVYQSVKTTAITLTLLFRSVGAVSNPFAEDPAADVLRADCVLRSVQVIFGIISDRYGRKWPLVANLILIAILELGAGFVQTFKEFLALRSLFGITMGGIWGLAASTALENLPVEVRGLASGVLQQGYAVGYLLAAVINLTLVPETSSTWRSLFWCAAGLSAFAAFIRLLLPESEVFIRAKEAQRARGETTTNKTRVFLHETKEMLKRHWLLCIYAVLLMTGACLFCSSVRCDLWHNAPCSVAGRRLRHWC